MTVRLSSRQYSMLKQLPLRFDEDTAKMFNQVTLGSFARRGYVRQVRQGHFLFTEDGHEALKEFGQDQIYRKTVGRLSVYFGGRIRKVA